MAEEDKEAKKVKFDEEESPQQPESARETVKDKEDEDEGRRSRAGSRTSRSSRTNSAGSAGRHTGSSAQNNINDTANNKSDSEDKKNGYKSETSKSDRTDGLGDDFEIANKAIKREEETTSKGGNGAQNSDESKIEITTFNETETKKKNDKETKDQKDEEHSKPTSSYSLNSRKGDGDRLEEKSEKKSLDKDDTAYAHYFTEDVNDEENKEDEKDKSPKTNSRTMMWEDDHSKPRENKQKREEEVATEQETVEKTDDRRKEDSKTSTVSASKEQPQEEQPHLVTRYKKPEPVQQPKEEKPKSQEKETKPSPKTENRRHISQSAKYPSRGYQSSRDSRPTSSRATSRASRSIPSRPRTTLGFSTERRKEREFFHAELQRLKDSLRKESKKIKKPKVRDHYPDVFTSLEPYYNTYTANYLIKMPDQGYKESQPDTSRSEPADERDIMYTTRKTAIGLCDPWQSLNMDRRVLPKLETAEIRRKRIEQMHAREQNKPKSAGAVSGRSREMSSREKRPEAKQGSTRLPKFPVISPPNSDLATKELVYSDVPMLRDEMVRSFSHFGESRKQSDYTRTRQDFFRMELDRLDEYHQNSRPHMRAAYFAYLQNTPGSRQAIYDCMKEIVGKKKDKEQTPQAVA